MSKDRDPRLANWINLQPNLDERGRLTEIDFRQLPFVPTRAFFINKIPKNTFRGKHAHKEGSQLLFCLDGEVEVELRRGDHQEVVVCKPDSQGLLILPGIWTQQKYTVENSVLLVLSSLSYKDESYLDQNGEPIE